MKWEVKADNDDFWLYGIEKSEAKTRSSDACPEGKRRVFRSLNQEELLLSDETCSCLEAERSSLLLEFWGVSERLPNPKG